MMDRRIVQLHVLEYLAQLTEPIGAGALTERLTATGRRLSQPTVGRVLSHSDRAGITIKVSNKGRLLTAQGRRVLEEMRRENAATQLTNQQLATVGRAALLELRQALEARSVLESEAARLAALHASPRDIQRLWSTIDEQRQSIPSDQAAAHAALDFHEVLAEASGNRFVASALHLIRTSTQHVRALMAALGVSIGGESIPHHVAIAEAISAGNSTAAENAAGHHINEFVRYVDGWLAVPSTEDGAGRVEGGDRSGFAAPAW